VYPYRQGRSDILQEVGFMAEHDRGRMRVVGLSQADDHRDVANLTPGERMGLMWQLTLDA